MTRQPASATDHFALTQLLTETAWRIDHGRADTVWELFTEDGEMRLGGAALRGRDAIRTWGAERPALRTRHVHTNTRFTHTGDDTAEGVCVLTVYMDDGTGGTTPFAITEETGHYVRTEDGWRFAARITDVLFGGPNTQVRQGS